MTQKDKIKEHEANQCVIFESREAFDIRFSSILARLVEEMKKHDQFSIQGLFTWIWETPIVQRLSGVAKKSKEYSLESIAVLLFKELTFKSYTVFMNFVHRLVVRLETENRKTPMSYTCFLKIVFSHFVELSSQENSDLNNFLATRSDKEKRFIELDITDRLRQQTMQSIAKFENEFDEQYENKSDLSDERKVELLIEENAEQFIIRFQQYFVTAKAIGSDENENSDQIAEFKEIVKQILKQISSRAAAKYSSLVIKLVNDHGESIQWLLGRSIQIDVFITDIYHLLGKISADIGCANLNEFLLKYAGVSYGEIEKKFKTHYKFPQSFSLKLASCKECSGCKMVSIN